MHNPGMLMVYLPKETILIEADSFSPPPGPITAPPNALPNLVHFFEAVQRLRLDVDQHLHPLAGDDARRGAPGHRALLAEPDELRPRTLRDSIAHFG